MKAKDFDKKFDSGVDITAHLDRSKTRRPGQEQRRVNVDFPLWMIELLDKEARRIGVTRQSIIKLWISQYLSKERSC
jgi:hypothetical protein